MHGFRVECCRISEYRMTSIVEVRLTRGWHNRCSGKTRQQGRRVVIGSGSSAGVARRFGGGGLHLSDGGSFGGTELPFSQRAKGRAADKVAWERLGGAFTGLISSHKPIRACLFCNAKSAADSW